MFHNRRLPFNFVNIWALDSIPTACKAMRRVCVPLDIANPKRVPQYANNASSNTGTCCLSASHFLYELVDNLSISACPNWVVRQDLLFNFHMMVLNIFFHHEFPYMQAYGAENTVRGLCHNFLFVILDYKFYQSE